MKTLESIGLEIGMIIFGVIIIFYMSKRPPSEPLTSVNFKGYAAGIAFILLGIIFIMNKLNLW